MTVATKTQKRIQEAYAACYRLCESDRDACQWLERSLDAARRGEKQHRRIPSNYRHPIADAARYFAVKWFLDTERGVAQRSGGKPLDFADACSIREDALYGLGARDAIMRPNDHSKLPPKAMAWHKLREEYADVLALDYVKEFTR